MSDRCEGEHSFLLEHVKDKEVARCINCRLEVPVVLWEVTCPGCCGTGKVGVSQKDFTGFGRVVRRKAP